MRVRGVKRAWQVIHIFTHNFVKIIYHFQKILTQFVLLGPRRDPADHRTTERSSEMRKAVVFVVYLCTGSAAFMAPVLPGLPGLRRANSMQVCHPSHNTCQLHKQINTWLACTAHQYVRMSSSVYVCVRTSVCMHVCASMYRFILRYKYMNTFMNIYINEYLHKCILTYLHVCTHKHRNTVQQRSKWDFLTLSRMPSPTRIWER